MPNQDKKTQLLLTFVGQSEGMTNPAPNQSHGAALAKPQEKTL